MVTVSILLNPGMSKMREPRKQSGEEKAGRAGPSEQFLNFGLFWARGARRYCIPGGDSEPCRGRGESLGPPSHWTAHSESTWFCLALFSNSALNQLEEEC